MAETAFLLPFSNFKVSYRVPSRRWRKVVFNHSTRRESGLFARRRMLLSDNDQLVHFP
jgi:hypothetical protein